MTRDRPKCFLSTERILQCIISKTFNHHEARFTSAAIQPLLSQQTFVIVTAVTIVASNGIGFVENLSRKVELPSMSVTATTL